MPCKGNDAERVLLSAPRTSPSRHFGDAVLREEIYQQVGGDFRELRSAEGHSHAGGAERVRGALARSLVIVKKNCS